MLRPKSTLCYTPQLEQIAQEFIERKIIAKKNPENDQMGVDFLDDLYKWSLESVACLALNTRLGMDVQDLNFIRHPNKSIFHIFKPKHSGSKKDKKNKTQFQKIKWSKN